MSTVRESNRVQFLPLALAFLGVIVFLAGLLLGNRYFSSAGAFAQHRAVISRLTSPLENPHGYLITASALAISAALMLPAVRAVFVGLRESGTVLPGIGSILLALGFLGEISLGCLVHFWHVYGESHMILAFATFVAISSGLTICLALAARLRKNYGLLLLAAVELLAVITLIYMLFNPNFPSGSSFLSSIAFLEWLLCLSFIVCVLSLVASVTLPAPSKRASPEAL